MTLLNIIKSPIPFEEQPYYLCHPTFVEIEKVISEIQKEELDLRRLIPTRNNRYASKGKDWLEKEWKASLLAVTTAKDQIIQQRNGIVTFQEIPSSGFAIPDPFNMEPVESQTIDQLKNDQLQNSIIVKNNDEIIAFGRLLEVEGSIEIVSLWTKLSFRKQGIAGRIIKELLSRSIHRPIYSFQELHLIPYYLKQYNKVFPSVICPFEELPHALQRDLFRMNIFWGPNVIIRIGA